MLKDKILEIINLEKELANTPESKRKNALPENATILKTE